MWWRLHDRYGEVAEAEKAEDGERVYRLPAPVR
jgi:hypothetical protein